MRYRRHEAKDYARERLRGIWAATLTPFTSDLQFDETGWRANLSHWYRDLGIQGLFVNGKQGEFASMTLAERRRAAEMAVEEAGRDRGVMVSCSDQSIDTVVELARHAEAIGAEYVVVHTPLLYFGAHTPDTLFEYYRHIASQVEIGVALWNQPPDCGYTLAPETALRLAELPNVVAIKYSVPRELYARLTRMAGEQLIVSSSSEEDWLDNIAELGWQVYLCSTPPFLLQTPSDRRMQEYTRLAFEGQFQQARHVRDSLEPARKALKESRPAGKAAAHQKYWQELLGQVGGRVRRPLLELTEAEKAGTRAAFAGAGLHQRDYVDARARFRVLVVDDNRDDVGLTARVLRREGHEVEIADSGRAAMDIAQRFRPEIALVDLVLPDVEGCDLVKDLKALPGMEHLRIFILSGYGEDVCRQRAASAGCDGYLVKPLEARSLATATSAR